MEEKDKKIPAGEIVVQNRFVTWVSNVWYHHKWAIVATLFLIAVLTVCLVQCAGRENTDLSVAYAGNYVMNGEQKDVLRRTFHGVIPADYNEDGNRAAALYTYAIFSDEEMRKNATSGEGVLDSYTYQAAKRTNVEEIQGMRSFLQTGEWS